MRVYANLPNGEAAVFRNHYPEEVSPALASQYPRGIFGC